MDESALNDLPKITSIECWTFVVVVVFPLIYLQNPFHLRQCEPKLDKKNTTATGRHPNELYAKCFEHGWLSLLSLLFLKAHLSHLDYTSYVAFYQTLGKSPSTSTLNHSVEPIEFVFTTMDSVGCLIQSSWGVPREFAIITYCVSHC